MGTQGNPVIPPPPPAGECRTCHRASWRSKFWTVPVPRAPALELAPPIHVIFPYTLPKPTKTSKATFMTAITSQIKDPNAVTNQ